MNKEGASEVHYSLNKSTLRTHWPPATKQTHISSGIASSTSTLKRLETDKQLYGEEEMEFLSGLYDQAWTLRAQPQ